MLGDKARSYSENEAFPPSIVFAQSSPSLRAMVVIIAQIKGCVAGELPDSETAVNFLQTVQTGAPRFASFVELAHPSLWHRFEGSLRRGRPSDQS
jgi:hypothetical protein